MDDYKKCYAASLEDPKTFWAEQAQRLISWSKPFTNVLYGDFVSGDIRWFEDGQLNAAYNCLDRHQADRAEQAAIIWESDDGKQSQTITYAELLAKVCALANGLKKLGVKKGDRVCIYLPMIPEAAIAMLACARMGVVHSVVFGGFSAEALRSRILDAECNLVITANVGMRGNKIIPLKQQVDIALKDCPAVKTVIVVKRLENETNWVSPRDVWYHDIIANVPTTYPVEPMQATDPLFILYTSGSTGKPKGILHSTGGYLVYVAMTFQTVFAYQANELFWCTADIGWITGHSYTVYGPLLNGATTLMFEGVPNYPTPARYWEVIDKYKVNILYTAPTVIRALRKEGDAWVENTKRQSLRLLGTVGEPINVDAWKWYFEVVGENRCPIVDTWWQTETGGIMITPVPGMDLKPGSAGLPFFGIQPDIVNDEGKSLPPGEMGKLVIRKPWPGLMQTIYGDPRRFANAYFAEIPGCYVTGDQAYRDEEGNYWIEGRSDDVIKVSGHRIGSQEIETAIVHHPQVAEAAVVAVPDDIKGHAIYAFVTLKTGTEPCEILENQIIQLVRELIGPIATPQYIQWAPSLPKTRSGKIMRRLLRKIAIGDTRTLGDLTTLAEPEVVQRLIELSNQEKNL